MIIMGDKTLKDFVSETLISLDHKYISCGLMDGAIIKFAFMNSRTLFKSYLPMSFNDVEATKKAAEDILTKIKSQNPYQLYKDETRHMFMFEEGYVEVSINERSNSIDASGTFTNETLKEFVESITKPFQGPRKSKSTVYTVIADGSSLTLKYLSQFSDYDFEVENYEDKVVESFDHIIKELANPNPCGRLIVVNGKPGTGKTNFIKGLINQSKQCNFVIVPFSASQLSNPSMVNLITSVNTKNEDGTYRPIVFILEDADSALVPRGTDNMSDISTLLNLSDGVLGHLLDMRIIATTNAKTVDLDPALTRAGRLCQMVNIDELSERQANIVWCRLTNTDTAYTSKSRVLADIYAAAKNQSPRAVHKTDRVRVAGFGA